MAERHAVEHAHEVVRDRRARNRPSVDEPAVRVRGPGWVQMVVHCGQDPSIKDTHIIRKAKVNFGGYWVPFGDVATPLL